LFFILFEIMKF